MSTQLQDLLTACAGISLILWVISDVFQSIIVPHYRPGHLRLSPALISRVLWVPLRALVAKFPDRQFLRTALTLFAPAAMLALLGCWLTIMIFGYCLVLWSERAHIVPHLHSMEDAFYFAATSVLTIGFGDVVALTFLARLTVVLSAVSGIVLLALTVSFLFATQSHFHNREVTAQIISSRSLYVCNGALLFDAIKKKSDATALLELCERWVVEIYQSHTAYPFLLYFRSRSSRICWLSQMGAVLDTASLLLTVGPAQYSDVAHSIFDTGSRALSVFMTHLTLNETVEAIEVKHEEYIYLFRALGVKDPVSAAVTFASYRQVYYSELLALCEFFAVAPPSLNGLNLPRQNRFEPGFSPAVSAVQQKISAPGMTAEFHLTPEGLQHKR